MRYVVDNSKLPGVEYGYIPQLGTLTVRRGSVLVGSKRDARHYYPGLRVGQAWEPWLAGPPVQSGPLAGQFTTKLTWPMGFRGSCAFAQGVTDVATQRAGLPDDARLLPSRLCPLEPPVWASILDDVWVLYSVDPKMKGMPPEAASWLLAVDLEWARMGVIFHPAKRVDNARGVEVQGGRGTPHTHEIGLSNSKTLDLTSAIFWILTCFKPSRKAVESGW